MQTAYLKTDRRAQGMSGAKAGGAEGEGEINEWVRRAGEVEILLPRQFET